MFYVFHSTIRIRYNVGNESATTHTQQQMNKTVTAHKTHKADTHTAHKASVDNHTTANKWMSFADARKHVRSLGLKTAKDYMNMNEKKEINIPVSPNITYKDKGWTNWYDFLGKEKKKDQVKA